MPSPPYSPGGRLIECSTTVSTRAPAGRARKLGAGPRVAPRPQPSSQSPLISGIGRFGLGDAEPRHPVAHLPQRQPEAGAGGGAGEVLALERAHEDHALDLVEGAH